MSPTADERQAEERQEPTHKAPIPEDGDETGTAERPGRKTTRSIIKPRLEIGSESFAEDQIVSAQIHIHSDDQAEFRSASVILNPPLERRWDYHGEVRIHEDNDLLLTGICTEVKLEEGGRLHLKLRGPFWRLERTALQGVGTFGMSNKETFYWLAKLTNPRGDSVVEGLQLNDTFRPFIFAVPLKNLKFSGKGLLHLSTDAGIASHDYETTFKPILALFKEIAEEPAWNDETPKLFGVVFGDNLLKADRAARERAEFLVGIMNLALRTGMSHFETRYGADPIAFDADTTISPVSFHPWVIIREAAEVKGWVRRIPTAKLESEISLDGSLDRIGFFLKRFNEASSSGDVHVQLGRRQLTARERKLSARGEPGTSVAEYCIKRRRHAGQVCSDVGSTGINPKFHLIPRCIQGRTS